MPTTNKSKTELMAEVAALQARIAELEGRAPKTGPSEELRRTLREQGELLHTIINAAQEAIIAIDEEGLITLFNPAAEKMFGRARTEMLGQPIDPLMPEAYREPHRQYVRSYFSTGHPHQAVGRILELPGLRRDGTEFPMDISLSPVRFRERKFVVAVARDISERKRMEAALRESEELYRIVTEFASDCIYWRAPDGRLIYVSPACRNLTGYGQEEFLHDPGIFARLIHPDDQARWEAHSCEALSGGQTSGIEFRIITRDGQVRWVYHACWPIHSESGEFRGVRGSCRDITRRKEIEQQLQRQARYLRGLAAATQTLLPSREQVPFQEFVNALGPDSNASRVYVFLNERDQQGNLLMTQVAEWCAPGIRPQLHDPTWQRMPYDRFYPHWRRVLDEQGLLNARTADLPPQTRAYLNDGGVLSLLVLPIMVDDEFAGFIGFDNCQQDRLWEPNEVELLRAAAADLAQAIKRQRTEQARRDSERRFRLLAENLPGVVYLCRNDRRYTMLYLNDQVEELTGYPPEEFLSDRVSFADLYHPEDAPGIYEEVDRAVAEHRPFHLLYRIRHRNGEWRWLEEFGTPVFDAGPEPVFLEGFLCDVTDRQKAEEERRQLEARIQQAQKLESLGLLAGGIAHDFNNLLVGVMGYAGLAQAELPPDSPARASLARIEQAAQRAADLTGQMLAYSGRGQFVITRVNLTKLVEEMAGLLRSSLSERTLLQYEFAEDLPPVEADATQIRQVVMNLITNANEAIGEEGGVITVRTGVMQVEPGTRLASPLGDELPPGRYAYFEVQDTGCGMDAETQAKIFDPFFTTKLTGRGLGLAAVLGIVRGHRGTITVDSAPGCGTRFRVLLPPCEAGQPTERAPAPAPADERPVSGTVLVVDDEETVREVARAALEMAGFTVLTARDGREALDCFRARPDEFDALLIDLRMPFMPGDEVLREVRRLRPDVPVVLSSGYTEQDVARRVDDAGPIEFIHKPYRPNELVAKLQAVMRV